MKLDQFKFKKSLAFGVKEEAVLKTNREDRVEIKKTVNTIQVIKFVSNVPVYDVSFQNNEKGLKKLDQALKTIGKRK